MCIDIYRQFIDGCNDVLNYTNIVHRSRTAGVTYKNVVGEEITNTVLSVADLFEIICLYKYITKR